MTKQPTPSPQIPCPAHSIVTDISQLQNLKKVQTYMYVGVFVCVCVYTHAHTHTQT